jgi:flagellar motor switch protein FliN
LADLQGKSGSAGWLTEEWVTRLASSIELMTEVRPGVDLGSRGPANDSQVPAAALWISVPLNLGDEVAIFVGAAEESWQKVGRSALLAAGVTEATTEDARGTYLEIVTQAASGLAQSIAQRIGKPVASLSAREVKLSDPDLGDTLPVTPMEISLKESSLGKLYVGWSSELEVLIALPKPPDAKAKEPNPAPAGELHDAVEKSKTFDLLMEVELPVSVSFGRAQLPLRDVLKLNSGSIVELNRTISDPVEIIVNNCVIARGEVVVLEGNYGVRIQHVISREERLRTLQ